MFGPKGPLNSEKLKEKIASKVRFSRSASENEVLKSEIDRLPNVMENSAGKPKVFETVGICAVYSLMIIVTTGVFRP